MSEYRIDAVLFKNMFISGANNLELNKSRINDLNVFPVPDGDTGTNMSLTISSAVNEIEELSKLTMSDLSSAISHGSLRGARGNSGVILSQLLRGFTREIQTAEFIDKKLFAAACERAVETAYKAVMKPKEGTILTVAKGIAKKAAILADEDISTADFLAELINEGNKVLQKTPELLPVLKEAGVVDSGGQGLMAVWEGAYSAFIGKPVEAQDSMKHVKKPELGRPDVKRPSKELKFGYCTEFIILLYRSVSEGEIADMRNFLNSMGDSIVMVPDEELIKIHVHTNEPGAVLQRAISFGELSHIKIDNMREEHREMLGLNKKENLKALNELTDNASSDTDKSNKALQKKYGFISVSSGEGFEFLFKDMGVDVIINGGQTMNPSTDDFINAIKKINSKNIFIYPNNKNIILAANQARDLTLDKSVIVIPTKTVTQGITAMINFSEECSPEENAEMMNDSIKKVRTSQITYSVRDSRVDDFDIKEGDIMAVGDHHILSSGSDINEVALKSVETMVSDESEIISVYYGNDFSDESAEELVGELEEAFPECAVEMHFGGQPVYYCIISVE